jgi:hypothetical protein
VNKTFHLLRILGFAALHQRLPIFNPVGVGVNRKILVNKTFHFLRILGFAALHPRLPIFNPDGVGVNRKY